MRTARPEVLAMGISARFTPRTITWPIPPAAISAAITTIESESMRVWLRPAMIEGRASGSWTSRRSCSSLEPNARPASTTSVGTWRMPRSVSRTMGGSAKMMVTITAGVLPRPKKNTAGNR